MDFKDQSDCYRIIKGEKWVNYSDLMWTDESGMNEEMVAKAKSECKRLRIIKRCADLKAIFVPESELVSA